MSTIRTIVRLAVAFGVGLGVLSDVRPAAAHSGDDVVIQFTTGGGLGGPCCEFWDLPELTVYADGRLLIVEHADGEVPEFTSASVPGTQIDKLLDDARDAGLLGPEPPDTGAPCCDLAYTRVSLLDLDPDALFEYQVIGLGFEGDSADELTAEQHAARAKLLALKDELGALAAGGVASGWYVPRELALLVNEGRYQPDDEPQPWPLGRPLSDTDSPDPQGDHCIHVTGADVRIVLDAIEQANNPSWTSDGAEWNVWVRPLLPHEHGCPQGGNHGGLRFT